MMFFIGCLLTIAAISYYCWHHRRAQKSALDDQLRKYRDLEALVTKLIAASSDSAWQADERIKEFYRDFPGLERPSQQR
jgi:hypothetical protein